MPIDVTLPPALLRLMAQSSGSPELRAWVAWLIVVHLLAADGRNDAAPCLTGHRGPSARPVRSVRLARGSITGRRARG